jgi:hypothetical protein
MALVMTRSRIPRALCCLAWALLPSGAAAAPWDEPTVQAMGMEARAVSAEIFLGDGEWGAMAQAWKLQPVLAVRPPSHPVSERFEALEAASLSPELAALGTERVPTWTLTPGAGVGLGDLGPVNAGGDAEPGMGSVRLRAGGAAYAWGFEALVEPELRLEVDRAVAIDALPRQAWGGWRGEHLLLGFGMRDRWLGPGRRGALLLSDNARAAPMGSAAAQGHLPGRLDKLGCWRFETSWGWLQRPRDDVDNPGLMLMDLRWLPVPWIELGATRMGMFGGAGRPLPGLWELLVPTEPHIYDDPDKDEPDQNEIASLDFRLTLPLARWIGGPVDYLEGWWQYGAEDIIARHIGAVPYPSLAGVANLWGLEAAAGPWVLSYEGSHILDDYFRWYVSHRVYHEGFTQDGRVMGHHSGGDAMSSWLRAGWYPLPWGADLAYEQILRVGIVESLEDNLLALATDERRWGLHARLWRLHDSGSRWAVGYGFQHIQGEDFVPGADRWVHRVSATWTGGPVTGRLGRSGPG